MEFLGKFRGKVIDNKDPLKRGRLKINVPAISDHDLAWAEPCTPYAGPKVGWYVMPPAGANVWIEFERGDVDYPIWTGCFWGLDEKDGIPPDATDPEIKVFQTEKMKLILDDKTVKLTALVETDKGKMSLVMDKSGIVVTADTVTITATPDKIELKKTPATIEITDAITLKKEPASITISNSIALKNAATSTELSQAAIDLKNGASSISLSPATVSINNGALEVM
jgi:uncharacterized protein involved in type VI secretion and phage assembly